MELYLLITKNSRRQVNIGGQPDDGTLGFFARLEPFALFRHAQLTDQDAAPGLKNAPASVRARERTKRNGLSIKPYQ